METRLFFAILSAITWWLYSFLHKIAAEKHYNISFLNLISYWINTIIWIVYFALNFNNIDLSNIYMISLLAIWNGIFFYLSLFSRIIALKNVDTVIFFPLYKTFWPIMVTLISLFYFNEMLTSKEVIWIILWILIPLLLITNNEKKIQKNLFLWLILIIITSFLTAISSWFVKEAVNIWTDLILYISITSITWFIMWFFHFIFNYDKNKTSLSKWIFKFSILSWFTHFLSFVTFIYALEWNLAIVFTVNSFSILIPIILSIIFYKDHFNFKKWFVVLLSIVSIILFI